MSDTPVAAEVDNQQRTFVLDTNVVLYDPNALFVFHEHNVVIPMTVIEELDRFKKDLNETGRNARAFSRYLDQMREVGSLHKGVELPGGGILKIDFLTNGPEIPIKWGPDTNDNRILRSVLRADRESPGRVALVTRDTNMRLKCDALGVAAEDYQNARIDVDEQYTGVTDLSVPSSLIDELYQSSSIPLDGYEDILYAQQFVLLQADDNPSQSAMARVDHKRGKIKLVMRYKEGIWGIFARNKEQLFAMNLLLDDDVKLVTLNGVAGTGKTLLALACGLQKTADDRAYRRMLVSRPIFPLGKDIGFLPGDVEQKLNPWMKPIFDNLEFLISTHTDSRRNGRGNGEPNFQGLFDQKLIEVEPLTYIRGRSIPKQYLIVDEAQNLTPHEVKTVLTRAGESTKVILTGDPYQIDNPYVDGLSNGLTYTVERFKESPIAGHVTLTKGERSELAELAASLL